MESESSVFFDWFSIPSTFVISLTDFSCLKLEALILVLNQFLSFIDWSLKTKMTVFSSNFPTLSKALNPLILVWSKGKNLWECLTFWPGCTVTITCRILVLGGTASFFDIQEFGISASAWHFLTTNINLVIFSLTDDTLLQQWAFVSPSTALGF